MFVWARSAVHIRARKCCDINTHPCFIPTLELYPRPGTCTLKIMVPARSIQRNMGNTVVTISFLNRQPGTIWCDDVKLRSAHSSCSVSWRKWSWVNTAVRSAIAKVHVRLIHLAPSLGVKSTIYGASEVWTSLDLEVSVVCPLYKVHPVIWQPFPVAVRYMLASSPGPSLQCTK